MALPVEIKFGGKQAKVTPSGELVVAPLAYDSSKYNLLDVNDTAYNFVSPKANKQFIITGFIAVGNKSIAGSPAEAIVEIYEATSSGTITVDKVLITFAIATSQEISPVSLRILVNEGKWVNAKMDNDDVHLTIFGYFIDKV